MRIGLCDVDSTIPNLALMKLSSWHKARGDSTELYMPLMKYDTIYASKIFTFTPDNEYMPRYAIRGGSGYFDYNTNLTEDQEHVMPDYDLYKIDYSCGFITRGCIRKCKFCIVPKKEGAIYQAATLNEFHDKRHKNIIFFDNNILAMPEAFESTCKDLIDRGLRADWNQALDVRLVTSDVAKTLLRVKRLARWRFSFDTLAYEKQFRSGIETMLSHGHRPQHMNVFIFCGPQEGIESALRRIDIAWNEYGIDVFLMIFRNVDGSSWDSPQKHDMYELKKWCNNWNNKRERKISVLKNLMFKYGVESKYTQKRSNMIISKYQKPNNASLF